MGECRAGAPVRDDSGELLWTYECTLSSHEAGQVHEARDAEGEVIAWWPDGKEFIVANVRLELRDPPDAAALPAPAACRSCRHWESLSTRSDWQVDVPIRAEWIRDQKDRIVEMKDPQEWEARKVATEHRYGVCTAIVMSGNGAGDPVDEGDELVAAFTQDGSGYRADLVTLDTFACALHEPPDGRVGATGEAR